MVAADNVASDRYRRGGFFAEGDDEEITRRSIEAIEDSPFVTSPSPNVNAKKSGWANVVDYLQITFACLCIALVLYILAVLVWTVTVSSVFELLDLGDSCRKSGIKFFD